jgi:uncharacterized protein YjcR
MNRAEFARQERRRQVAELYLEGYTQTEIGHKLGVPQPTVSYDLRQIDKQWQREMVLDRDQEKRAQLKRIAKREREAWAAWQRSCTPRESTTREATDGGDGPERRKAIVRTDGQVGDPRFLAELRHCVQQRSEILGLITPPQVNLNILIQQTVTRVADQYGLTPEEVLAEAHALLSGPDHGLTEDA